MTHHTLKLVLLPGLDGTGRFFSRLERRLAGRVATQIISYPAELSLGYRELIDFVRPQIEGAPVVLLGESFSGPIAVNLAAALPERVKGLILAATFLTSPWPRWMLRAAARFDPLSVPRFLVDPVLCGGSGDPELTAQISEIMAGFLPDVRATRLRAVADADATEPFQRLTCPVLALHGRSDWLVPRSSIARAVRAKPGAVMKLLEGPHMLLQRNAPAAAVEIEAFMTSIEGPQ